MNVSFKILNNNKTSMKILNYSSFLLYSSQVVSFKLFHWILATASAIPTVKMVTGRLNKDNRLVQVAEPVGGGLERRVWSCTCTPSKEPLADS